MKVLSVVGQKGGSGKTTVTVSLAVEAVRAGKNVAIIDLDPQASAANWGDRRGEASPPAVVSCQASRLEKVLAVARSQEVELVLIDTPGKSAEAAISAIKVANHVIIPVEPHMSNLETLANVAELLALAGRPNSTVVINKAPPLGKRHEDAREAITARGFSVAPVILYQRAAHSDATNLGITAAEHEPKGKAATEMALLYDHIDSNIYVDTAIS